MKRSKMLSAIPIAGLFLASSAHAVTVWYQPTPYPLKSGNGVIMEQDIKIVHIHDGWVNNNYPAIKTFQRDDKLKIGGWSDIYRGYMNWDLVGLPKDPTNVALWLNFYPSGASITPFHFCIPNSTWDTTVTWDTQPALLGCTGAITPPSTDSWAGWYITPWYQNWQNNVWGKHGIMLHSQYNGNNFDFARSSRYADYVNDPYAGDKRPMLQFDFTPTFDMKMPLPGNHSWNVTTEVGGYDCMGAIYGQGLWPDKAHADDINPSVNGSNDRYFSIDFSWRNKGLNGTLAYIETSDIPILAVAGGKVIIPTDSGPAFPSGNYIVIDHDGDGNLNTGVSTWYAHLKYAPKRSNGTLLQTNDMVIQGDQIGVMGTTGQDSSGNPTSTATHLHFGVKYGNGSSYSGASAIPELTKVIMERQLLKSYQTECAVNSNGVPTSRTRYYTSTNQAN